MTRPLALLLVALTLLHSACSTALVAPTPQAPTRAASATATQAPVLVGTVTYVTDADTLKVQLQSGPITVRLDSIDAPEHDQPQGA